MSTRTIQVGDKFYAKGTFSTTIKVGDQLVSGSGVLIDITGITVSNIHRQVPRVHVTYVYDDNGHTGTETVSLDNFYENLIS